MRIGQRQGFSLIEALVVLVIGGMALAIIFNIGVKAGDTGFGLGRRAIAAADSDIVIGDIRSVIRSLALRPSALFIPAIDRPVIGSASRLEGDMVMERATQCAPLGWSGRMVLSIETRGDQTVLVCSAGNRSTVLTTVAGNVARFAYSRDGQSWTTDYSNLDPERQGPENFRAERLWVRIILAPSVDIVETAFSGRPQIWVRPDASL
jgi:prepilin-type N-terminal cleavage/methylation domain-containing protein